MKKLITGFGLSEAGQVGMMLGLLSTPLILAVGGSVDYARAMEMRKDAQNALDISTVKAASVDGEEPARKAAGKAMFDANFHGKCNAEPDFNFKGDVVKGTVNCSIDTSILQVVGFPKIDFKAASEVILESGPGPENLLSNACIISLDKTSRHAVTIAGSGKVDLGCGVYSRSNNRNAAFIHRSGDFKAPSVNTVGGYAVSSNAKVETIFNTGAPVVDDPLEGLPIPDEAFGTCDFVAANYNTATKITLSPGIYCGGLKINTSSNVEFQPGVYVFRGGNLSYSASGNLTANEVLWYFEGSAKMTISSSGNTRMTGLQTGKHAGFAIIQSNDLLDGSTAMRYTMSGNSFVEGTIYLPRSHLTMNMSGDTAIKPAYTAYIADKLTMNASGNWTVRTNYETATPLPLMWDEALRVVPEEKIARIAN